MEQKQLLNHVIMFREILFDFMVVYRIMLQTNIQNNDRTSDRSSFCFEIFQTDYKHNKYSIL